MRRRLLFIIMSAAFLCDLFASDSLPFPASVGGHTAKDGMPFEKIENPAAVDAELLVESKDGMIIVNVIAVHPKNEPVPGSTPAARLPVSFSLSSNVTRFILPASPRHSRESNDAAAN